MEAEALAERLAEAVPTAAQADRDVLLQIIPLIRKRIKTLSDFDAWAGFFFAESLDYEPDLLVAKKSSREEALAVLEAAESTLAKVESWDAESLEAAVRTLPDKVGCKGRPVFMGLRVAVTGSTASPPLFESMEILGREKTLIFIRQAIERLREAEAASA